MTTVEARREAVRARRAFMGARVRTRRTPPVQRFPNRARLEYARALRALLDDIHEQVTGGLVSQLPRLVQERDARRDGITGRIVFDAGAARGRVSRNDAPGDEVARVIRLVRRSLERDLPDEAAVSIAAQIGQLVESGNRDAVREQLRAVLGVDVIGAEGSQVRDLLAEYFQENRKLIKNLPTKHLEDIEGAVLRGLRQGQRAPEIAKEIARIKGVSDRRAQLIARDQVNKLNGELTKIRQESIGITHYVWSTSGDERVRPEHAARDGKTFSWARGPADGHPGQPINCRCNAIPVVDPLLDEEDAARPIANAARRRRSRRG